MGLSGRCSPTGYEAFLEDTQRTASDKINDPAVEQEPDHSSESAPATKTTAAEAESWTASITTGAQGVITSYFPPENRCTDCPDESMSMPTGCADLPQLAASSSSEKSGADKSKERGASSPGGRLSGWADKIRSTCHVDPGSSACYMDTACCKAEFEKEPAPATPPALAPLTEQGERLALEGPPPPQPWTDKLSSQVQEAQTAVSSQTRRLFSALGLSAKKDQALMTDFYPSKPGEKPKPKIEAGHEDPARTASLSARNLLASGMSAMGLGPKEETKEKKQTLITDFDANQAPPTLPTAEEPAAAVETDAESEKRKIPEVPDVPSLPTIATEIENPPAEEEEKEKGNKWNPMKHVKGFLSKFKLPEKVTPPTCEVPAVPQVEVPSLPYFGLFSCHPQAFEEEPTAQAAATAGGQVEKTEVDSIKTEDSNDATKKVDER